MTLTLENALAEITVHHLPLPKAFQWASNGYRGGRSQAELEAAWADLPLEERVSLAACLMGGPVYSPASHKLVSDAYLALCYGQNLDTFCADRAARAQHP